MVKNARGEYRKAIEIRDDVKKLIDLFIDQPETYYLTDAVLNKNLRPPSPDFENVLRCSLDKVYKPATAAISLVLHAGIEENAKINFDLIKHSVAKLN